MSLETTTLSRTGTLIAVVGPSGAGKDTLIRRAAERYEGDRRFVFARRVITRPADAGSEDHDTLDEATFEAWEADGRFCLTWRAHGLAYGLPAKLQTDMANGASVIANLSRRSIAQAVDLMPHVAAITVSAPREILVERILARGREDRWSAKERVARKGGSELPDGLVGHWVVDNSGTLDDAVSGFCAALEEIAS
ncbi:MAG: phosphonate metabolism protein/1,5-bisphosphokinase (PRPP-forming) PhnN [Fulvimarina manganoxydans]|uniref:phosphonate metabolism protein/1,5-bisphosphokinase (PRPP-forming) PhnN n=1 Tax=Fulvimarina manganoxydans TaxID=937218 RepID=UPI002355B424|nr:phosphonate metabolism protein/1,5-bisphosphokinase (PRPP-forming) PhnN [Fulvimarina manganoxydans]MCK5930855.1 phosphonate metabolism protein/1,5-bisphosphokinase (PRPP-forming) PhnN [Fulvimarina manganoxydans]